MEQLEAEKAQITSLEAQIQTLEQQKGEINRQFDLNLIFDF